MTPPVSIVIPTFNEADNIAELVELLNKTLEADAAEIIFVDDSSDDTPGAVARAAETSRLPVRLHHRDAPQGGLGGAVVEGMRLARGGLIVVMDADLQHPPGTVPALIAAAERADLVVASRYARGGNGDGLDGNYRLMVSRYSTLTAKLLFFRELQGITDPMSGFFAINRAVLRPNDLRPLGYKILLELVVRCRPRTVAEVPYRFGRRFAGESKSSVREGLRFVRHLGRLRFSGVDRRPPVLALGEE
ncbi:polyprenol monophosphomannose synthase [Acrocarpospora catenulata]|uniref:polyprenol monophosphomannose synthase n=1 Tax=Acrocarpospora catenulata TaxID=2836182 RepID=UPI001BDACC84|nr:polyprenol monophosphomannose synthase [Acrocarpospora catenulata]